jgi:DNA-binding transcriptional MerR regulator
MAEPAATIPNRPLFKPAEVCEIAGVQPFVLRSWEAEFPNLGVAKDSGALRVYRRTDVERVLQIKQLVFGEGLTLAGARRRLETEAPAADPDAPSMQDLYGRDARDRLLVIKRGLESVLELLLRDARNGGAEPAPPRREKKGRPEARKAAARSARPAPRPAPRSRKAGKSSAARAGGRTRRK